MHITDTVHAYIEIEAIASITIITDTVHAS